MTAWFTVTALDASTFAISEWGHWEKVHSFLLLGEDEALLIDTGLGIGSIRDVVNSITALPVTVCTTHIHSDHIGGHHEFERFFVHQEEVEWLRQGIPGRTLEQVKADLIRDCTKPFPKAFSVANFTLFTGQPTRILKDGETIQFGTRQLEVLHTPGHSPGHICLFEEARGYLFTGDLLYLETPIYAFYPSTNPQQLMQSLRRISQLKGVKKIYGSHNQLGMEPSIFHELKHAIHYIEENNLAQFGTGEHRFGQFAFRF